MQEIFGSILLLFFIAFAWGIMSGRHASDMIKSLSGVFFALVAAFLKIFQVVLTELLKALALFIEWAAKWITHTLHSILPPPPPNNQLPPGVQNPQPPFQNPFPQPPNPPPPPNNPPPQPPNQGGQPPGQSGNQPPPIHLIYDPPDQQ